MGNGYVRQSAADIQDGQDIVAGPLTNEFNALRDAFDATAGHSHDGTTGESQQISLTTSVTGILPIANGGTNASTAPAALVSLGLTATAAELNTLDGVTASTAELNILDGVTATAAEINVLDGITASTAELNLLDGVTATTAEINKLAGTPAGLTATELGYVDGVTSSIQTQIDSKLASASYTAADVLSKLLTVDGAGSGLDADLLDGKSSAVFPELAAANTFTANQSIVHDSVTTITMYRDAIKVPMETDHQLGSIVFKGKDSAGNPHEYSKIVGGIEDDTNGSEDGRIRFLVYSGVAANFVTQMQIDSSRITVASPLSGSLGSVSAPAYAFGSNNTTGLYQPDTNQPAVTISGTEHSRWTSAAYIVGATATWANTAGTQNGVILSKTGQVVASMSGDSAGSWRRQTSDGAIHTFYRNTTAVGSISVTASATAYNTSSDERLKENFEDFDAGSLIDQINMYHYDWKVGGEGYGPKAQELYEVFPVAVTPGNNLGVDEEGFEPWTYDASKLVPLLVKEIQSLRQRLDAAGL